MTGSVASTGWFTALAAKMFRPKKGVKVCLENATERRNDRDYRNEQKGTSESGAAGGMACRAKGTLEEREGVYAAAR
jgi:hypothetical protein